MKILFVLNSGFDTPGPSNHLLESVIERFLLMGDRVHIIAKHKTGQNSDIPPSIQDYKTLTYDICKVKDIKKNSFIRRYIEDIKYAFSSIKYYKKQQDIDLVFLQSCNTAFFQILFLKLSLKKPIVYNVQDIFPLNAKMIGMLREKGLIYKILSFFQRCAYTMADKIITISDDMKETIVNEKVEETKIDVIYNWSYSDEVIEIRDINNKFLINNEINDKRYKVVYAGNIGTVQNIEIILNAAKLLQQEKDICFYIIGDGANKEKCIQYVDDNNLNNVVFYPMQSPEYASHIYSMADINIIPLRKGIIKTALPSKTAICLSVGKPIIACIDRDSKFAMMLESCDKCYVVDSNDVSGLAKNIKNFYIEDVRGYSSGARILLKNKFSKEANTKRYVYSIKELIRDL